MSTTSQIISSIKEALRNYIEATYQLKDIDIQITAPTDKSKADLVSTLAFSLSKQAKKSPELLLGELTEVLSSFQEWVHVEGALPGFLNFTFTDAFYGLILEEVLHEGTSYGKGTLLEGQRWVVEHTSPNPNKAMHIGHLRTNLIGMALANIIEFLGAHVVRDAVDNNRGIAIAKAMWGYLEYQRKDPKTPRDMAHWAAHKEEWYTPRDRGMKADHFVGECYLKGAAAFKDNKEAEEETRAMVVSWEGKNALVWELWEYMLTFAHEGMNETLTRLGNRWDQVWHEHEHYEEGKEIIEEALTKGIFKKLDDGAILTQLESYGLPDTIVLKSDGTALYITQDIALTKKKKEHYQADRLLWVIGPEQAMAMKQLFAVCEQLKIGTIQDFTHISYGLVNIVDEKGNIKKMSSRGGETLFIDDLLDQVKEQLSTSERSYAPEVLEQLAVSAVKYAILRIGRSSNVNLNLASTVSMDGDSGVYILYTLGRINSLLAKQEITEAWEKTFDEHEKKLLAHLYYFPRLLESALKEYAPNLLVDYILTLSQLFNSLYNAERFLSEDEKRTNKKLMICKAASEVYATCLRLLGMDALERV